MLRFLLLLSGVFFCSTSILFIRISQLPPSLVTGYRLLFAAILLAPMFVIAWKKHRKNFPASNFRRCLIPASLISLSFMSWAAGARMTYVANASLIMNLTPVVMPFLAHFLIREKVTRREILGTLVALIGIIVLSANAFSIDPKFLLGNIVCFGSMVLLAAYFAYGRINRDFPSIWLYMVPIYAIAASICFLYSFLTLDSIGIGSWDEFGWMVAIAIVPTILGHVTFNRSLRNFTAQTFSVVNLLQFVFAGIMGWLIFNDIPPAIFYPAAAFCITGAIIVVYEEAKVRKEMNLEAN